MAKYIQGRINEEIQKEMTSILRRVKDPRVSEAFISITSADCTADLKYAKIYYSALRGDKKEVYLGLKSSAGFIRRMVAQRMNLRVTPELTFVRDSSSEHGAHISELLHKIENERAERVGETEPDDEN